MSPPCLQPSAHSISSDPGPIRAAGTQQVPGPSTSSAASGQGGQGGQGGQPVLSLPPPVRGGTKSHPPFVITVTDPVRRENTGLFGLKGE